MAFRDFEERTPIIFRTRNPLNDKDYIHITAHNTGCWSYVGRLGGVSNRVQGVVTANPALRTAQNWVCSFNPYAQIYSDFTLILIP